MKIIEFFVDTLKEPPLCDQEFYWKLSVYLVPSKAYSVVVEGQRLATEWRIFSEIYLK